MTSFFSIYVSPSRTTLNYLGGGKCLTYIDTEGTLTSIKDIEPVYSAGLVAEIGDIHRFKDQAELTKFESNA